MAKGIDLAFGQLELGQVISDAGHSQSSRGGWAKYRYVGVIVSAAWSHG